VFGTDSPMLLALKQNGIDVITELGLDDANKEMILSGTAKKLLKL
jgi:predicted TIM-barrel fold metal-dependent hydrolase